MSLGKKSILIVEDSLIAAKTTQFILEKLGCEVEHVIDGEKAVQLVKEKHYDGICMDIGLPTISGVEACLAIRKYEATNHLPTIPIIAVTGNNSAEEAKQYLAAGMQEVIDKPFTKEKAKIFLSFCK